LPVRPCVPVFRRGRRIREELSNQAVLDRHANERSVKDIVEGLQSRARCSRIQASRGGRYRPQMSIFGCCCTFLSDVMPHCEHSRLAWHIPSDIYLLLCNVCLPLIYASAPRC
jgi:hypothetical protein